MRAVMFVSLRNQMQDKGLLFWMILLPIIFTVLFISMFTNGVEGDVKEQIIVSIVPGYVVMFVFFIMISMVNTFLKDKHSGMVARLASTPLKPQAYLVGKWIPFVMIVLMQITILFTFGKLVYHIPIQQPLYVIGIACSLSFVATTWGLLLSLFVKTENMGVAITQIIALGGAMVGGLWMPLEMMPSIIQSAAKGTPQYWAHQSMAEALLGELTFSGFMLHTAVLLAFGVAALFIAFIRYPAYLRAARN